ncbi:nuclear transport factor 2 family protein [Flavobacterium aquidurense]|uniref:SnoaL 4 domain containing protein n=1 Tax=Flavobacterium aquidurense TaxID=362413 RepID=A0A0Q0Y1I8_9FLAO|nr:nuclear transport factor 2 family protein [Flavobacterium aquidurense]KQB42586.1 SnoaL 4 domain containing protein [Flavobacterium aquidurense]
MNHKELEDRILLKELVDKISILGDKKDFSNQVQLFSENAISETIIEGKTILKLEGRKTMASAFAKFLSEIETVYHFNGQQFLTLDGDTAKGTCYCLITLIGNENGKKMMTKIGAIYKDDYIRIDNNWFIAKRTGTFEWQEKNKVNQ